MRGKRGVCFGIIEHRINGRRERGYPGKARKNRPIADFGIDDKSGTLRHLQQMEISRVRAHPRFDHR